jgi:hypothetical protein
MAILLQVGAVIAGNAGSREFVAVQVEQWRLEALAPLRVPVQRDQVRKVAGPDIHTYAYGDPVLTPAFQELACGATHRCGSSSSIRLRAHSRALDRFTRVHERPLVGTIVAAAG